MTELITEAEAWHVARDFAAELAERLPRTLRAVVVVGSLADETYVPGRSDIDTVVILTANASAESVKTVRSLQTAYTARYRIPKSMGAVTLRTTQLWPPYDPQEELVPEILRLRHQGRVIWGTYDLTSIPAPSAADVAAYMAAFYPWLYANYVASRPAEARTSDATVNTILYTLRLLIWQRAGEYVLAKRRVVEVASSFAPEFRDDLPALAGYLAADPTADLDTQVLSLDEWEQLLQRVAAATQQAFPFGVSVGLPRTRPKD